MKEIHITVLVAVSIPVTLAFNKQPHPDQFRRIALENFRDHPAFNDLDTLDGYVDKINVIERRELK